MRRQRVIILGAGYAGLMAVRALRPVAGQHEVTLVDQNPYHTLETELWKSAATGEDDTLPLGPLVGDEVRLYPSRVEHVDLDAREVGTADGPLSYDLLLIAVGSVTNFFGIDGLARHALELKTAADARAIYTWLLRAHHPGSDVNRNVLIGGGGLTGVELASELAERSRDLARESGTAPLTVHIVEATDSILTGLEPSQHAWALRRVHDLGLRVHTKATVVSAQAGALHLAGGETLEGGLIVWAGGVRAPDFIGGGQLERGRGHRLVVDHHLEVRHYPGVFAAGDVALALDAAGKPVAGTAQAATQQGEVAGHNLRARLEGQPLRVYSPSSLGELVSLGHFSAVGWVKLPVAGKLRVSGHVASLAKRASSWRHLWEVGDLWP